MEKKDKTFSVGFSTLLEVLIAHYERIAPGKTLVPLDFAARSRLGRSDDLGEPRLRAKDPQKDGIHQCFGVIYGVQLVKHQQKMLLSQRNKGLMIMNGGSP